MINETTLPTELFDRIAKSGEIPDEWVGIVKIKDDRLIYDEIAYTEEDEQ